MAIQSIYPVDQETYSVMHLGAEYVYEFISGSKMSD